MTPERKVREAKEELSYWCENPTNNGLRLDFILRNIKRKVTMNSY